MRVLRNKLAKKLYETGILYIKMDEFEPARMSFNQVLDLYYDADIIESVHYQIIQSYLKQGNNKKARSHWINKGKEYITKEKLVLELNEVFLQKES